MAQMIASPHAEVKPVRLILGLIACVGIVFTLITLLFGFTSIPANSVVVKTRFGAYHDVVQNARGQPKAREKQDEAYALRRINEAKGEAQKVSLLLAEYGKAPEITRRRL